MRVALHLEETPVQYVPNELSKTADVCRLQPSRTKLERPFAEKMEDVHSPRSFVLLSCSLLPTTPDSSMIKTCMTHVHLLYPVVDGLYPVVDGLYPVVDGFDLFCNPPPRCPPSPPSRRRTYEIIHYNPVYLVPKPVVFYFRFSRASLCSQPSDLSVLSYPDL